MGKKRDKETKRRDNMYADSMGFQSAAHMAGGNHDQRKDMMKRYNLNESDYASEGAIGQGRVTDKKSYKELNKELMYRASNDYDARRAMEAAAMSGDKKAKKFAKKGVKNVSDLIDRNNLMRDFHKDMGNGGSFSSEADYAGVSYGKVKEDRAAQTAAYDQKYAKTTDLNALKDKLMAEATDKAASTPIEPSDRMAQVEERLEGAAGGSNNPPSLFDKDNAQPAKADDQKDAARNFLEDYKLDVAKGANIRSDIETGVSNAAKHVRDTYGR